MIDLSGIARQLRLSVDQLRIAADLLEQGYQPSFIARFRADETGKLSKQVIWSLKLEIDRQQRLQLAREKAKTQLPKDSELDEEANKALERASSETDIEVALRCWRARRNMSIALEKDTTASTLLEKLLAYDGPKPEDIQAWAANELGCSQEEATAKLNGAQQLIATILQGDTRLAHELRSIVCKKAQIHVEMLDAPQSGSGKKLSDEKAEATADAASNSEAPAANTQEEASQETSSEAVVATDAPAAESVSALDAATPDAASNQTEAPETSENESSTSENESSTSENESAASQAVMDDSSAEESAATTPAEAVASAESVSSSDADSSTEVATPATEEVASAQTGTEDAAESATSTAEVTDANAEQPEGPKEVESWSKPGERKKSAAKESKSLAKMTPRQRRRRWLVSMIQPMKSLKKNVGKLTAYQQLMLGRGRRSQIVKTNLKYDERQLVNICRDAFVRDRHGMSAWFTEAVRTGFESSVQSRIEADTLAVFEERAQERLLESATDQLRRSLTQRPVRGHVILVVDTIGPKSASVAVISPEGSVLHTDEVTCSAQPDAISQNMVKLGEIAHRYRVSMIALTNGPARRFLVLSVKELITASEGKLRLDHG